MRLLAGQALSRAGGAPLVPGNSVRILKDAKEHYPAWLSAIATARRTVFLENYIFADDEVGREFVTALAVKAGEGVRVRVIYDWLGSLGVTSNTVGAAITDRRVLGPAEAGIARGAGLGLLGLALIGVLWPLIIALPLALLAAWAAIALLVRSRKLRAAAPRSRTAAARTPPPPRV